MLRSAVDRPYLAFIENPDKDLHSRISSIISDGLQHGSGPNEILETSKQACVAEYYLSLL